MDTITPSMEAPIQFTISNSQPKMAGFLEWMGWFMNKQDFGSAFSIKNI